MAVDYSRHAADYDRVRADEAVDRDFWLRGLVEVGRLRDGERVLDFGAGTGRFAHLLATTNRVVALDSSNAMLRVARAKGHFECVEGDGYRLPFRGDTFDLLPPGEYERGLRFLETEMPRRYGDRFEISARFTFVGATR